MKKYNVKNYIRYKEDIKRALAIIPVRDYVDYTDEELKLIFLPLVENVARKFSTAQEASGVMSIMDLLQEGSMQLCKAVGKLDRDKLLESEDKLKSLKSFFAKRIRGGIRREIDKNRAQMRIPEHKLNEIRKNPKDDKMVALFFNSMFSSYDITPADEDNFAYQLPDKSEPYNIALLNTYLLSLMQEHLTSKQYDVVRLFYGLDCNKHSAKEIADYIGLKVPTATVIVSQIKKEAIDHLIANVDSNQVIDYL